MVSMTREWLWYYPKNKIIAIVYSNGHMILEDDSWYLYNAEAILPQIGWVLIGEL